MKKILINLIPIRGSQSKIKTLDDVVLFCQDDWTVIVQLLNGKKERFHGIDKVLIFEKLSIIKEDVKLDQSNQTMYDEMIKKVKKVL